jgi:hypothetical protein
VPAKDIVKEEANSLKMGDIGEPNNTYGVFRQGWECPVFLQVVKSRSSGYGADFRMNCL